MDEEESARRQSQVIADSISPLQETIREIQELSRRIPAAEDFHFFSNFESFKNPVKNLQARTQALLSELGECKSIRSEPAAWPNDPEESYDWLVSVQDDVLEGVGAALDQMGVGAGNAPPEFLLEKKKKSSEPEKRPVRVASKRKQQRNPIPFHVKSLARPQDRFDFPVDNSNEPFMHLCREELLGDHQGSVHAEGLDVSFVHPLKEDLDNMSYMEKFPAAAGGEPLKPKPLSETPFTFVESLSALETMAKKLEESHEFAVDLENHHYRSFQGFVCLMQVSTRLEDFVVDTLTLRDQIGPALRFAFANPSIRKVIHGSDRDIIWLQRDFKIYVCNAFDTGQAARVLNMERCGLAFLLEKFCGVQPDKRYQLADWRLRPLTVEMLRYAREDTHYLLYVYDKLKEMLLDGQSSDDLYVEVCKRSRDLCLQLYEKDLLTETSFKQLYGLADKKFGPKQISIVEGLHAWRDKLCRREDESTGYILPNNLLFRLAEEAPEEPKKLQAILKGGHPVASFHASEILDIIRRSKASISTPAVQELSPANEQQQQQQASVKTTAVVAPVKASSSIIREQSIVSPADQQQQQQQQQQQADRVELSIKQQVNTTVNQLKKSSVAEALFRPASTQFAESDEEDEEETLARMEKVKASVFLPFLAAKPPEFEEQEFDAPAGEQREALDKEATQEEAQAPGAAVVTQELGEFIEVEQEEEAPVMKNSSNSNNSDSKNCSNSSSRGNGDELPPSLNQMYGKKKQQQQRKQEFVHHPERKRMKSNNNAGEKNKGLGAAALPAFSVKKKSDGGKAFDPSRAGCVSEDFKPGKKRQVFPRSGNRSATFK